MSLSGQMQQTLTKTKTCFIHVIYLLHRQVLSRLVLLKNIKFIIKFTDGFHRNDVLNPTASVWCPGFNIANRDIKWPFRDAYICSTCLKFNK